MKNTKPYLPIFIGGPLGILLAIFVIIPLLNWCTSIVNHRTVDTGIVKNVIIERSDIIVYFEDGRVRKYWSTDIVLPTIGKNQSIHSNISGNIKKIEFPEDK